jgi:hypothetical protein
MRTEISNPPITGILNEESLKNWNLYGHQEELFLPVIIDGHLIQFTDTMISTPSGDEYYFVKMAKEGELFRYGFILYSYEPDCDGAYHSFSLINFDQYYYANLDAEEFKNDRQKITLIDESEVIDLLRRYSKTKHS